MLAGGNQHFRAPWAQSWIRDSNCQDRQGDIDRICHFLQDSVCSGVATFRPQGEMEHHRGVMQGDRGP